MFYLQSARPAALLGPAPGPGRTARLPDHRAPGVFAMQGQPPGPGPGDWSSVPGGGAPSVTCFSLPFFAGEAQRLRLHLRAHPEARIRIDTIQPSRMHKAYLLLDGAGRVLETGDELREARSAPLPDGGFEVEALFQPWNTRLDFLLLRHEAPGEAPLLWRDLRWDSLALDALVPSRGHPPAFDVDGVLCATGSWMLFRDYLHLEFEVLRPGALLCGLSLETEFALDHASWWTSAPIGEGEPAPEGAGLHPLTPRRPNIAYPSPGLMDRLGPAWGQTGNCVRAVLAEPVNLPYRTIEEGDRLTRCRLHARFSDGHAAVITPALSMGAVNAWQAVPDHYVARALEEGGPGQVFLELGARGPSSAALRARLDPRWRYVGTDIEPGPNVDLVADAHELSRALPHGSAGVCYSNSVMEHLLSPERVVTEVNALLRPGGIFFAFVPTTWPLHAEPWDYQRFTIHKWPALLNAETGFEILESFEAAEHVLVPTLPYLSGITRNQHARAPAFAGVVARKTGPARAAWTGWRPGLAAGRYDP